MILKVITLAAILAVIETRPQGFSHGQSNLHGHGHAYSSQSIMMHQEQPEPVYYHQSEPYQEDHQKDHYQIHRVPSKSQSPAYQPINPFNAIPFNNVPSPSFGSHIKPDFDKPKVPQSNMPFSHQHGLPVINDHHSHSKKPSQHIVYPPQREYEFNYNIADIDTGDHKTHHESRDDGVVKGVYSFQEADGRIRIVEYTADEHNGFHATVRHEGLRHKVPKNPQHIHQTHQIPQRQQDRQPYQQSFQPQLLNYKPQPQMSHHHHNQQNHHLNDEHSQYPLPPHLRSQNRYNFHPFLI